MTDQNYDLVPTSLAVAAMRDNGYRNTAYAVAELIDNAIQAQATSVQLLCCERQQFVAQRARRNIHQIAVLDNGSGMDAKVLRQALQFGNGEYLNDRTGIGRFGMGLPSSSISQCRRVDVWTWQSGPDHALYSHIDLDDVEKGTQTTVPEPKTAAVPKLWRTVAGDPGASGTLVVWSQLDRCMWKTARTIIRNSEYVIGRMYRRFIHDGSVAIRLASFVEDTPMSFEIDGFALVNDPLYLMVPCSTPAPYDKAPMFQHDGDHWEVSHKIDFNGAHHTVITRFTVAREEARNRPNAGSTDYGRHAKNNVGISLLRAGRELELELSLVNSYDPRERWWGVEIEFPPTLDEIFGVTNNKQSARHFSDMASVVEEILSDASSIAELKERLREDEDPTAPLLDIIHLIDRRLRQLRKAIQIQTKGTRAGRRRHGRSPEERGTEVTKQRQDEGHRGESDEGEDLSPDERKERLAEELEESGLSRRQAGELAAQTIDEGLKYTFQTADLEGRAFFTVKPVAGEIVIKLNVNHPAYKNLVEILEDDASEEVEIAELVERLNRAAYGLKLLLMAWARFEDEAGTTKRKTDIQDLRTDWGRYAAQFLEAE